MEVFFPFAIAAIKPGERLLRSDSGYRIVYLGEGRLHCKTKGGFKIYERPCFLVIPPLTVSGLRYGDDCRGYCIDIGSGLFDELSAKVRERGLLRFPDEKISIFLLSEKEKAPFHFVIRTLIAEWNEKRTGFRDIIRLKLQELCIGFARLEKKEFLPFSETGESPGSEFDIRTGAKKIRDICAYLEASYDKPLSLEDIARESGFSASYLSRYFKAKTGLCLFDYINRLRIKRACYLLKNTDKKIIEIAYDAGYNNLSFFNRIFRRTMRCSPAEYRRTMRK